MEDYSNPASAYGGEGATGQFNPVAFVKKPTTILRIVGWVFSVVVIGCIASQCYPPPLNKCIYDPNNGPCGYGTFVGVMAFLGLLAFLFLSAVFDNISNVQHRKYIVIADVGYSGVMAFFWFVCFCFLTNKWTYVILKQPQSGPEAVLAFSFFSIIVFGALTYLAVRQYQQGISDNFMSDYNPDMYRGDTSYPPAQAPYAGGGAGPANTYQGGSDTYQQSPFAPADPKPAPGGYQPQSY